MRFGRYNLVPAKRVLKYHSSSYCTATDLATTDVSPQAVAFLKLSVIATGFGREVPEQ